MTMFFEEPTVEYVELEMIETTTTSSNSGGAVESCTTHGEDAIGGGCSASLI